MKIVVLGGAGDMGSATVQDLLKFTDVRQVTVAARNTSKAEKMVSALGDPRAVVQKIDASSHVDLVKVMQGLDVAAGAWVRSTVSKSRWWKQHSLLEWTM